jgi:hypothetical protein
MPLFKVRFSLAFTRQKIAPVNTALPKQGFNLPSLTCAFFFSSAKYCSLIDKEGGLQLLEELINGNLRPAPYPEILKLAGIVRQNVAKWRNSQVRVAVELLSVGVVVASLGFYEEDNKAHSRLQPNGQVVHGQTFVSRTTLGPSFQL